MARKAKQRERIPHQVVRKIDGKKHIRFVVLETSNMEKAFTVKQRLPRITHVDSAYRLSIITQIKKIGFIGSKSLMSLFPEFERTTIGQLIRHHG